MSFFTPTAFYNQGTSGTVQVPICTSYLGSQAGNPLFQLSQSLSSTPPGQRVIITNTFISESFSSLDTYGKNPGNSGQIVIYPKSGSFSINNPTVQNAEGGLKILIKYISNIRRLQLVQGSSNTIVSDKNLGNRGTSMPSLPYGILEISEDGNVTSGAIATSTSATFNPYSASIDAYPSGDRYSVTHSQSLSTQSIVLKYNTNPTPPPYQYWVDHDHCNNSTGLQIINNPGSSLETSWGRAISYTGGSGRSEQQCSSNTEMILRMGGTSVTLSPTSGFPTNTTLNSTAVRPWFFSVVFKADLNNSNQHIFNSGEGAASNNDNFYLRLAASGNLYFGWGKGNAVNELYLFTITSTSRWYGVYVATTGERQAAGGMTAAVSARAFNVMYMSSADSFGALSSDLSTTTQWNNSNSKTSSGALNVSFQGDLTIGGRGTNRSFHGDVAAVVVGTLRRGTALPSSTEIEKIIKDPVGWMNDYKVGNSYRPSTSGNDSSNWQYNVGDPARAVKVWLMGDGASDTSNTIMNQAYPGYVCLRLDNTNVALVNATIPGLS